jgi:transposase
MAMEMHTGKFKGLLIILDKDDRGIVHHIVCCQYVPVARFNPKSDTERKLAAIDLVEQRNCSRKTAGQICGFHRNTVTKLVRTKKLLGIEAVTEDNRGLKEPYKYIRKVRAHIKEMLSEHPDWKDQDIADQATKDLKMQISRSAVARIRTEDDDKKDENSLSKADLIVMARLADNVDKTNFDKRQLELNFEWDKEIKEKAEQCSKEEAPESAQKLDQRLIDRLQQGERFNFCGALMYNLFLQEIGFYEIASAFPLIPGATYQSRDILAAIFHSINLGIPSIEALKLVNADELGVLLGMNRAPDKETIRDHLSLMAKQYLSDTLIDRFAQVLLRRNFIDPEVFFIDGHFLPYYGLHVIAKGYYTVRRLAMRGNELYVVTDLQGRPLFFITESNEIDFRPIISRSAAKLVELGIPRPMLVFDRGGYGIHFFKELDEKADFVTWAKYVGDKALATIQESGFTVCMQFTDHKYLLAEEIRIVKESAQTASKEDRAQPSEMKLRMVVLNDVESGKRMAVYTNNMTKPLYDIARYMLNRWGDSENNYKEMMARFNLNYHPGYDIKELENQPLVDNPDIALIKKAIRTLHKEIEELEKEILLTQLKEKSRQDIRRQAKISKAEKLIEEKKEDISGFTERLVQLPEKVSIIDLLKGKPMTRCDLEKKKLYDLMQFMAYNSRERLVELFRECYDDPRDVKQVLDMITGREGYIKLVGQTVIVVLDWIQNKKHRKAAVRFCRLLNHKNVHLIGRLKLKLAFYVSNYPLRGSNAVPKTEAVHNLT